MLTLILIALSLGATSARIGTEPTGCRACIDGNCYTQTTFRSYLIGIPAFDLTENILYLSEEYTSRYTKFPENGRYENFKEVTGVPYFVKGHTVDQNTRKAYVWMEHDDEYTSYVFLKNCSYLYDPIKGNATELVVTDEAIKEMYFKEKLYYTLKFRNGLFKYENNPSIPAFDGYNISQFVIDRLEDIYAKTANGVYRLKKGADQVTLVTSKNYFLSVDRDESIYFFDPVEKTILKLDYETNQIVEAGAINSEATDLILFDKFNNILYRSGQPVTSRGDTSWDRIIQNGRCRVDVDLDGKKMFVRVDDNGSSGPLLMSFSSYNRHPNAITDEERTTRIIHAK